MSRRRVELTSDAFYGCVMHALSTESEEVMGLLVGNVENDIVKVSVLLPLRRMDKRKDRVEPRPEQLSAAVVHADHLSSTNGCQLRVIGWYHSHPHITWMPSHVDCRTQGTMQLMDKDFIGIIVSCFHTKRPSASSATNGTDDARAVDQVQMTCFQAVSGGNNHSALYVPLDIVPTAGPSRMLAEQLVEIPELLFKEEQQTLETALCNCSSKDVVALLQNLSVYTQALCSIMDIFAIPMLRSLQSYVGEYDRRLADLRREKQQLQERLKSLRNQTKTVHTNV